MVEYRVLSSAMMKDVDTLRFVWHQLQKAINACNSGYRLGVSDDVVQAINESDPVMAKRIIEEYDIM